MLVQCGSKIEAMSNVKVKPFLACLVTMFAWLWNRQANIHSGVYYFSDHALSKR